MTHMRLLEPGDEPILRAMLLSEPLYNLFMIGDLELLGLGTNHLLFWGQFASPTDLLGVAMRYHDNWCFYVAAPCDHNAFGRLVDDYPHSHVINGHPAQVDPVVDRLEQYRVHELHVSYYCRMPRETTLPAPVWPTRRASRDDIDALVALYDTAGFMRRSAASLEEKLDMGRIVVAEVDGHIVSSVLTSIETGDAAMVGGVFTPASWRNRGYASAAMTQLCADLLADGKQPCLFYDNPAAGSIYRRLGFEDIGPWHLVRLQPRW